MLGHLPLKCNLKPKAHHECFQGFKPELVSFHLNRYDDILWRAYALETQNSPFTRVVD